MAVFTVNGQKVEPTGNQKLLRFLRDELHLTSVKDGCSEGACGACTVIIDGKTCKACVPDTDLLDGRTVITVEGLTEWEREVYTYAYGKAGAVQCGFCIPGMVMCTKALLDVNKEPTDDEIKYALRNNYCRCTGYVKIMDAVRLAAKNAALGILAAAIMTDDTVTIENVPNVRDTRVLLQAIEGIGAKVKYVYNNSVQINGGSICDTNVEYDYIRKIRASYYLLGALLGKYNEAHVALPGGCNIGSRPIDQHIKGFKALGADVDIDCGVVHAKAEKLTGAHVYFDVVTVGATINLMMASCMAERAVFCIRKQKLMLVPISLNEVIRYVKPMALIGSFGIETSAAKKTDKIIQES